MTKKSNSIILIPFALVILLCFICPSIFLYHASHSSILDKNYPLSTTLYDVSKSQIVHDVSMRLDEADRIKLVRGEWESNCIEIESVPGGHTNNKLVKLAIAGTKDMYENGQIPFYIDTNSDSEWYSWKVDHYVATDSAFNIYSAYYCKITFTKYDSSVSYVVTMTEAGTITSIEGSDGSY